MILILATNLNPQQVCEALKKNNINYYETGIEHGTITAVIDDYKFEITSLREDVEQMEDMQKLNFQLIGKKMPQEEILQLIQFIQI